MSAEAQAEAAAVAAAAKAEEAAKAEAARAAQAEIERARDSLAYAKSSLGQNIVSLYTAIGQPLNRSYASSADGGENGTLTYNGFTVYTYRVGDTEIITQVIEA